MVNHVTWIFLSNNALVQDAHSKVKAVQETNIGHSWIFLLIVIHFNNLSTVVEREKSGKTICVVQFCVSL